MNNLARSARHCAAMGALAVICTFAAVGPDGVQAADDREARIDSATVDRNVYAGGGQVAPAGPVKGDFTAGGGKVVVDQPIAGDATVAGGSVSLRAPVGDDVRAAGGDVSIESKVGGELLAVGANITLTPSAAVGRGAKLYGSNVGMAGRIDGDLTATGQKVTINGEVRGNARLVAEEVELGPLARIGGALSYVSKTEMKKADGATIAGAVTREQDRSGKTTRAGPQGGWRWEGSVRGPSWAGSLLSFLALLAFGATFLLIVPRFGQQASDRIQATPWLALALGFGSFLAVPVLALLLFVSLLGIPLAVAVLALYPALLLAGFVVAVLFISRLLAAGVRKELPRGFTGTIGYFAAGLLLIVLVSQVPFVGALVVGLLGLAGVGACVQELYGRLHGPRDGPAAQQPASAVAAQSR